MKRLSEVTILTREVGTAAEAWAKASKLQASLTEGEGRIEAGDVIIRLVGPKEGSHVAGLIEQRGEGMFDIAIEVDDIDASVAGLRANGVDVTDPMTGDSGRQEAMINPASSHGVPIRLVEKH
jgi:hypothetical protein